MDRDMILRAVCKGLGPWSEPLPPNDQVSYDHCQTVGNHTYRVEWKSWKERDCYSVFLVQYGAEVYVTSELTLAAAQAAAETDHRARIAEAINLDLILGLVAALEAIAGYNNMPGVEWRAKHPELSAGFDISRRAKLGAGTALAVYARDRLAAFRAAGGEVGA
jgi:hypothetical protein